MFSFKWCFDVSFCLFFFFKSEAAIVFCMYGGCVGFDEALVWGWYFFCDFTNVVCVFWAKQKHLLANGGLFVWSMP